MSYLQTANGDRQILLELAATAKTTPAGCFVEVGVWKGGSASYLTEVAEQQNREIFLYDTFTGIPFAEPARTVEPPGVENVTPVADPPVVKLMVADGSPAA